MSRAVQRAARLTLAFLVIRIAVIGIGAGAIITATLRILPWE